MAQAISLPLEVVEGHMHMEGLSVIAKAFEGSDEFTRICSQIHNEVQQAKGDRFLRKRRASQDAVSMSSRRTQVVEEVCEGVPILAGEPYKVDECRGRPIQS